MERYSLVGGEISSSIMSVQPIHLIELHDARDNTRVVW